MAAPMFRSNKFDLAVDTITQDDLQEIIDWMKCYPRLTMGEETKAFERAWAKWLGVKYAVLCNSGSSANLLMYAALDSTKRSGKQRVAVQATGWCTSIAPAIQFRWKPTMCEVDTRTFAMDPGHLEAILKREKPETVMLVHVLGVPADMTTMTKLQKKYKFNLLEDCCASHGARHKGRMVGTYGHMSSFSFYYGHHMSTIEGGVVCTNDKELYYHLLMLRSHGWLKDLPEDEYARVMKKYKMDTFHAPFLFVLPGYNLRSTDLNAHIGLIQLKRLDETIKRRNENHKTYQKHLKGVFDIQQPLPGDTVSSISFLAVANSSEERREVINAMDRFRIDTRVYTAGNLGRHPFWFENFGTFSAPVANRLNDGGFFLPNNQSIGPKDVEHVCEVVKGAVIAYRSTKPAKRGR